MALGTLPAPSQTANHSGLLNYVELQAYLQLSAVQLQALLSIQRQQDQDLQPGYQAIAEKRAQVRQLLSSDSPAAFQVGQLEIEIVQQQRDLAIASRPYRDQSFALLSLDQQRMLPKLADSLILKRLAAEALGLHLIDNPNVIGAIVSQGGVTSAPALAGRHVDRPTRPVTIEASGSRKPARGNGQAGRRMLKATGSGKCSGIAPQRSPIIRS